MSDDAFDRVEQAARAGNADAVFEILAERFRVEKNYPQLFETMLLRARRQIGVPLILTEGLGELPDDKRRAYEDAYIAAAREVGGLYLAACDIPRAWPYFRALGETAPVAAALDKVQPGEGIEPLIEIAYYERANPRKGFELILANYGTCSAITSFEQYPSREGREESIRLLVRRIHGDLTESLRQAIAAREGVTPETRSVPTLIGGRPWLFEENNYHIDTSHLASVVRFSIDLTDRESLALAVELTDYGCGLSPLFQYRGQPPFENIYADYGAYLRAIALGGDDADRAIAHFHDKLAHAGDDEAAAASAAVLVGLLARLKRYGEAIEISIERAELLDRGPFNCPTLIQLCELAGDRGRLMGVSRSRGDLLHFAAAALRS